MKLDFEETIEPEEVAEKVRAIFEGKTNAEAFDTLANLYGIAMTIGMQVVADRKDKTLAANYALLMTMSLVDYVRVSGMSRAVFLETMREAFDVSEATEATAEAMADCKGTA